MITKINLEEIETELNLKGFLRPFKTEKSTRKTKTGEDRFYIDYKAAVNLKDSKFLEIVLDDDGFKLTDEDEKGFFYSWEDIYKLKELNGFIKSTEELTDEDIEKEDEFLDKVYDLFLKEVIKKIKE